MGDGNKTLSLGVVIPCHNYGHYLGECVQSVLESTLRPKCVVLVDDDSSDDSVSLFGKMARNGNFLEIVPAIISIQARNTHTARIAGYNLLASDPQTCDVLCFLDAD